VKKWRWIDSDYADGATHMAIDRMMLENEALLKLPTMRVYRWWPHCISLGYHQSRERIDLACCREDGIDVVQRPTGGRAVLHAEEVTYSVIIPREDDLHSKSIGEIYHLINMGLVRGIRKLNVPAELKKRSLDFRAHYKTALAVSCFSAAAKYEILLNGKKLVGSAQRQLHEGVLQHGSLLLGDAHLKLPKYLKNVRGDEAEMMKRAIREKTISISGFMNNTVDYGEVVDAIKEGMKEELSLEFEEGTLTDEEIERAGQLHRNFSVFSGRMIPLPEAVLDE